MKDRLIECPCCNGACYEIENTPQIKTYNCFSCGFTTNSLMRKGEQFYEEQISILPELYQDVMVEDRDGLLWFPTTINQPKFGMVFYIGTSKENACWSAVKSVLVTEEEKTKYPIPGKPNQFYERRMDVTTIKYFEKNQFADALEYIGIVE